jgi:hypothetical protein
MTTLSRPGDSSSPRLLKSAPISSVEIDPLPSKSTFEKTFLYLAISFSLKRLVMESRIM